MARNKRFSLKQLLAFSTLLLLLACVANRSFYQPLSLKKALCEQTEQDEDDTDNEPLEFLSPRAAPALFIDADIAFVTGAGIFPAEEWTAKLSWPPEALLFIS